MSVEIEIRLLSNPEQVSVIMTCEAMSERAKKALKASEVISRMSREFSRSCDAVAKMDPSDGYSLYELMELEKEISLYFDNLLAQAHEFYDALDGPTNIDFPDWKTSPKGSPNGEPERDFGVRAFVSDGCLFIKTPLLPYSLNDKKRVASGGRFYHFSYLFTNELREKLAEIFDEIPPLSQKTITYLFVRPEGSAPASDNVDTKVVTDTICMYLFGGDSAATTSFRLAAIFDNRLPKGTYICVSEGRLSCPDPELILEKFLS